MTIIKPLQIRAARAILNWSREDLAKKSGISVTTIHNIENEYHAMNSATFSKLMETLERSNITFIGQTGVELNEEIIKIYHGPSGFQDFFDEVYESVRQAEGNQIIRITGVDETKFMENLDQSFTNTHVQRMQKLFNLEIRVITSKLHDKVRLGYVNYKCVEDKYFSAIPSYNYANKFAHIIWDPLQVIVINHSGLSEANAKQFDFIWDKL